MSDASLPAAETIRTLVGKLGGMSDAGEGVELLKRIGSFVGLPNPTLVDNVLRDQLPQDLHRRCGWPDSMVDWWFRESICTVHRDTRRCRVERLPFHNGDRGANSAQLSDAERSCRDRFATFGIVSNLVIPVHLPDGRTSLVGWASHEADAAERPIVAQSYCELIAAAYGFVDLLERTRPRSRILRPRERDCIRGVAEGKNYKEIARELQISPLTVCDYLAAAAKRLGARNRGHLVALAMGSGELSRSMADYH